MPSQNTATATYEKLPTHALVEVHVTLSTGETAWSAARVERPRQGTLREACHFVARQKAALVGATLVSFSRAPTAPAAQPVEPRAQGAY